MSGKVHQPPALFKRLFLWFCKAPIYAELQGDLEEEFHWHVEKYGPVKARNIYRKEIFKMLRPSVVKRFKSQTTRQNSISMYINFLKVAFRSLSKNRLFTFINITGLAIGMSVALLIVNLVYDAIQFDQFHENKARLYRVTSRAFQIGFSSNESATAPNVLAGSLQSEVPAVEEAIRIRRWFYGLLKTGERSISAQGIYTDPEFFDLFSFELEQGNPTTALNDPFSLVITREMADRLMPGADPMGELITIPGTGEFIVTGIAKNPPRHSHFKFQMLTGFSTAQALEEQGTITKSSQDWTDFSRGYVYFMLKEGQSVTSVENWLNEKSAVEYDRFENLSVQFAIQKVTGIIPGRDLNNQLGAEFTPLPLIILGSVAMAILLSACFNYTNLSIARALRRAKEIGVRKVVGSSRQQIFQQFTIETVMVTLISVFFSYFIFKLIKPMFLESIPRIDLIMQPETPPVLIAWFLLFAVVIGLMAGLFPALFFARIKPLTALSNKSMKLFSRVNMRKALIIVQFSLSVFFLITMTVVMKQYRYTMSYDMGFEKENVLNLSLQGNDPKRLLTELQKIPEVNQVSGSSMLLGTGSNNSVMLKNPATNDSLYNIFISASPAYFDIHDLQLVAGSIYEARKPDEPLNKLVVNEKFTRFYGYENPEQALGAEFIVNGNRASITGVIKDFNFQHLEEPIHNLILFDSPASYNYMNLSVSGTDIISTLDKIEKAWESVDEDRQMEAQFLDAHLEENNGFLLIFTRIFGFLGFIAASIACLGLLGMAVFNAETRTKEIGIRKTVGASVGNLVMILSRSFIKLILISGVIGGLLAILVLQNVILSQIHYHVNVGLLEVFTAIFILFGLAVLAVGSQTWRAARANPVEALRYE